VNELAAQIVALQVIDQEIDLVEDEITQVQTELDQRIEALAEREQHIDYLTTTIDELEKERRTLDDEMVDKIAHVKERQAKMMQVQTSREQTALLKEIEDAKKNVKENEEKIVSIMEQSEALSAELKSEKNLLKGEQTLAEEEKDTVKRALKNLTGKKGPERINVTSRPHHFPPPPCKNMSCCANGATGWRLSTWCKGSARAAS
jgi:predicted  nucleic acid-binding Zn-ribbon protein